MADHLGQNDVHDAPLTVACRCPFVFMPSLKQRVCQFSGPKNWCLIGQASVAQRAVIHQQVGRRNLSNIASQKYVTVEQTLWIPLAPQTHYGCQETASSVCFPPEHTENKKVRLALSGRVKCDESGSHSVISTSSGREIKASQEMCCKIRKVSDSRGF